MDDIAVSDKPAAAGSGLAYRQSLKLGSAFLLALALANCAGPHVAGRKGKGLDAKYGVAPSPKVIPDGEPIPKGGGRAMVGQPYVVGGRTYVPSNGKGYDREGWASWYGTAFHGRLTANGEIFDRESIAAAHPTLPLPSYVRVTNVVNKRSMIVRVNDRGPYEQNRLLDVSERVADALDFRRKGTTRVRVEYVGKASTNGSDDAKLLASLTTDGSPAPFGRPRMPSTMLADLRQEPTTRPAVLPRRLADDAPPPVLKEQRVAEAEENERIPAPAAEPRPVRVAAAHAAEAEEQAQHDVLRPLPPQRPVEMGRPSAAPYLVPSAVAATGLRPATVELLPPQRPVLAGIY